MKKLVFFALFLVLIPYSAWAISHTDVSKSVVITGGGMSIQSLSKTLGNGCKYNNDVACSPTQLSTTSKPCGQAVVCANSTNKGPVYVGGTGVTYDTGVVLTSSTDRCVTLEVDNVNLIYAASQASNDMVSVTYIDYV